MEKKLKDPLDIDCSTSRGDSYVARTVSVSSVFSLRCRHRTGTVPVKQFINCSKIGSHIMPSERASWRYTVLIILLTYALFIGAGRGLQVFYSRLGSEVECNVVWAVRVL